MIDTTREGLETHEVAPRRLTPTERGHEMMLKMLDAITAALTKRSPTIQRDSITTSRNAKADVQFEIVTYRADDEPDDSFVARSDAMFDHLHEKYAPSRKQNFDRDYLPDEKGKK
jgi:hypothetical protein